MKIDILLSVVAMILRTPVLRLFKTLYSFDVCLSGAKTSAEVVVASIYFDVSEW